MYKRTLIWTGLVVCALTLAACVPNSNNSSVVPSAQSQERTMSSESESLGAEGEMVYESVVSYSNPGGSDDVGFKLTVENGLVKSVEVDVLAKNSTSINRQNSFRAGLGAVVVGKPLAGLKVDRVGGSSLTTKAFNDWVATIVTTQ
jgi:hypothetical protein